MDGSIKNAVDIKIDDDIRPSNSSPDDHWLEPVGHGGEDPLFALIYPAAAVIGTVLVCIAPEVLGGSALDAAAEAEYEAVEVTMAALT